MAYPQPPNLPTAEPGFFILTDDPSLSANQILIPPSLVPTLESLKALSREIYRQPCDSCSIAIRKPVLGYRPEVIAQAWPALLRAVSVQPAVVLLVDVLRCAECSGKGTSEAGVAAAVEEGEEEEEEEEEEGEGEAVAAPARAATPPAPAARKIALSDVTPKHTHISHLARHLLVRSSSATRAEVTWRCTPQLPLREFAEKIRRYYAPARVVVLVEGLDIMDAPAEIQCWQALLPPLDTGGGGGGGGGKAGGGGCKQLRGGETKTITIHVEEAG